jgi:hypothetical protein
MDKAYSEIDHAKKMAGLALLHVSSLNAITLIQVGDHILMAHGSLLSALAGKI